jgi:hypothetical protein
MLPTLGIDASAAIAYLLDRTEARGGIYIALAGRSGQGWRHNSYRACVSGHVALTDMEEEFSEAIERVQGEVNDGADIAVSNFPKIHRHSSRGGPMVVAEHSAESLAPFNGCGDTAIGGEGV